LSAIAAGLNERGIPTAREGRWSAVQVRRVLDRTVMTPPPLLAPRPRLDDRVPLRVHAHRQRGEASACHSIRDHDNRIACLAAERREPAGRLHLGQEPGPSSPVPTARPASAISSAEPRTRGEDHEGRDDEHRGLAPRLYSQAYLRLVGCAPPAV
jgi:hypothetical protein